MASSAAEQEFQYADATNGTDKDWFSNTQSSLLNAINTIISCLTLLSNSLVITVMLVKRRVFCSFTNRLILHQSVIDAITGVVFFLHVVIKKPNVMVSLENTIFDELFCRLIYSDVLLWWLYLTSTYNLIVISLERFMATCYPVKHRNSWSKSKLKLALGTSWTIGFVYALFLLLSYEAREGFCQLTEMSQGLAVSQVIFMVGIEYVLPVVIIIYAYTKALLALTKKLSDPVTVRQAFLQKARRNLLITTLLAGVMFIVCWTPSEIYLIILLTFDSEKNTNYIIYAVCTALLSLNMCVNPVIYCFQYKHFRCQLMEMVNLKLFRRNRVDALGEGPPPLAIDALHINAAGSSARRNKITARPPQS